MLSKYETKYFHFQIQMFKSVINRIVFEKLNAAYFTSKFFFQTCKNYISPRVTTKS